MSTYGVSNINVTLSLSHFLSEHLRDVFSFLEVKSVISASPSPHTMLVKRKKRIIDVFCSSMFWWLESSNRNIAKFHHFVKYSTCIPTLYGVRGETKCRFLEVKLNISFKTCDFSVFRKRAIIFVLPIVVTVENWPSAPRWV